MLSKERSGTLSRGHLSAKKVYGDDPEAAN